MFHSVEGSRQLMLGIFYGTAALFDRIFPKATQCLIRICEDFKSMSPVLKSMPLLIGHTMALILRTKRIGDSKYGAEGT